MPRKTFDINLGNPFQASLIFLSHSWDDNEQSDYLYKVLKKHFHVWYDRSLILGEHNGLGLFLGQDIIPRETLIKADFILFLASEASMNPSSVARRELSIAESISIKQGQNKLGLVELAPYEISPEYRDRLFERFAPETASQDAERIVESIKNRLTELGGLTFKKGKSSPLVFQGGCDLDFLLNTIRNPTHRGLYAFNAILRAIEMHKSITYIRKLPAHEIQNISERLLDIYLMDQPEYYIARTQAVYLLSRLQPRQEVIATEIKHRYPDDKEEAFLYRTFHISLGFLGDMDSLIEYVEQLATKQDRIWQRQRAINEDFHNIYYGSRAGAIAELRETIKTLTPQNLLTLNVFTLGSMSNDLKDVKLLQKQAKKLSKHGVSDRILNIVVESIIRHSKHSRK